MGSLNMPNPQRKKKQLERLANENDLRYNVLAVSSVRRMYYSYQEYKVEKDERMSLMETEI